jgi:uncharacterized membrane protein HdeD (DUF308 family)
MDATHSSPANSIFSFRQSMTGRWWVVLIRGIFSILFGIIALLMPGITFISLAILWGIYAVSDGMLEVYIGVKQKWGQMIFYGVISLLAGAIAIFRPHIAGFTIVLLLGIFLVIRGITEIAAAIRLRKEIRNEWLLVLGGLLSIVAGLIIVFIPAAGVLWIVWMIAFFAILFGILQISLSMRLRRLGHQPAA